MEDVLKERLHCVDVEACDMEIKGDISMAAVYMVNGNKVFVKQNSKIGSRKMFNGELKSLEEISAVNAIRVPKPIQVFEHDGTAYLVTEFLEMTNLNRFASELGEKMAILHLHNKNKQIVSQKSQGVIGKRIDYVNKFGFDVSTSCCVNVMTNEWCKSWLEFFARNRLKIQLDLIERDFRDTDVRDLWPRVERNLAKCFPNSMEIVPSLLHGDFWNGNAAELRNEPCIFDPAAFYGHSEYDIAFSHMFDGFPSAFYEAYHKVIPKQPGFSGRQKLYQLFNYLNHWNLFGKHYKDPSVNLMREIAGWQ